MSRDIQSNVLSVVPIAEVHAFYLNGYLKDKELLFSTNVPCNLVHSWDRNGCAIHISASVPTGEHRMNGIRQVDISFNNAEIALEVSNKVMSVMQKWWDLRKQLRNVSNRLEDQMVEAFDPSGNIFLQTLQEWYDGWELANTELEVKKKGLKKDVLDSV